MLVVVTKVFSSTRGVTFDHFRSRRRNAWTTFPASSPSGSPAPAGAGSPGPARHGEQDSDAAPAETAASQLHGDGQSGEPAEAGRLPTNHLRFLREIQQPVLAIS